MPGMSGIDLAIYFRKRCPTCKVLLFSGQANTAHLLEIAERRGHQFEVLNKPIHPADLLAKLRCSETGSTTYSSVLHNEWLLKEAMK